MTHYKLCNLVLVSEINWFDYCREAWIDANWAGMIWDLKWTKRLNLFDQILVRHYQAIKKKILVRHLESPINSLIVLKSYIWMRQKIVLIEISYYFELLLCKNKNSSKEIQTDWINKKRHNQERGQARSKIRVRALELAIVLCEKIHDQGP